MKLKHLSLFLAVLIGLSGCATYKRCTEKFATTIQDSVLVQVPVSVLVPRDSVVTSFVTDTTYYYKEVQQGRARVIVERTPIYTTVRADCDTVTITRRVPYLVPGPTTYWGVNPLYKKAAWGFGLLWLATMIFLLFAHYFKLNIEKR